MSDPNSPVTRFQNWRRGLPPALRIILTANVALFVALIALSVVGLGGVAVEWSALPGDLGTFVTRPWTALTHGFINPIGAQIFWGLISFVFALAWLVWIGRDLERTYGSHQLLGLYLLATLAGAALALAWGATGVGLGLYAGAWAPVGAVVVAAGVLHPRETMNLFLLGPISMKWIAIAFVGFDFLSTWLQAQILDPSHVGAYLLGAGFALAQKRGTELGRWTRPLLRGEGVDADPMASYRASQGGISGMGRGGGADDEGEGWKRAAGLTSARGGRASGGTRTRPTKARAKAAPAEPTQADVDRILEKIHALGVDSLTKSERSILEKWSGSA